MFIQITNTHYIVYLVETMIGGICQACNNIKLDNRHGYLSSMVADQSGCGSTVCPWFISAMPGKVHHGISLYS